MLFLFNKAKIISYAVSVFTVVALLFVANSLFSEKEVMEVKANEVKSQMTTNVNDNVINNKIPIVF